jgi:predicted Zn-ribbon and HTH transcriptional regulator
MGRRPRGAASLREDSCRWICRAFHDNLQVGWGVRGIRHGDANVTLRKDLVALLSAEPRSVSSLAHELGLRRDDVEEDILHALRSARAAGHSIVVFPARCKTCGFTFDEEKVTKPGKCPACRGTRLFEPQISIRPL